MSANGDEGGRHRAAAFPMMKCPHCGSSHVRRSHLHFWEVPLKRLTRKRPHRCEDCRWRGWLLHVHHQHGEHPHLHAVDALVPPQGEPDLSAIDASISRK